MFTPGKVTELGERFLEDRHRLQHIFSREVFAWYVREERDVKLMHVRLVLLVITSETSRLDHESS